MSAQDHNAMFSNAEFLNRFNEAVVNSAPIQNILTQNHEQSQKLDNLKVELMHLRESVIPQLQEQLNTLTTGETN